MTKKRQDGSTFMVMFSGFPSTNRCFPPPMVLEPSCSLCKDLIVAQIYQFLLRVRTKCYDLSPLCISSTVFIFMLALVGVFYPYNRGALFTALVVIYALTSGIAGYTSTSFYCQLEGTNWVSTDGFSLSLSPQQM